MSLRKKVQKTIKDHELFSEGDSVVIGVSGGPDSICLLHILFSLSAEIYHLDLHVVHVNHQLRGKDADEDERYVREFCKTRNIPCHVYRFDVSKIAKEEKLSTEDAGRRLRYQAFEEVRESVKIGADVGNAGSRKCVIAVAQNANDQAETVLMRLMRGAGLTGMGGMEYKREDGVIRPLLDATREEIEGYCEDQRLFPRIDETNLQTDYTRNRIRLELLPYIKQNFNENIVQTLNRFAAICREDARVLDEQATALVDCGIATVKQSFRAVGAQEPQAVAAPEAGAIERILFPLRMLQKQPVALRHRMILLLFARIGLTRDMAAAHLKQADAIIEEGKTSKIVGFPHGYSLRIRYGIVVVERLSKSRIHSKHKVDCGIGAVKDEGSTGAGDIAGGIDPKDRAHAKDGLGSKDGMHSKEWRENDERETEAKKAKQTATEANKTPKWAFTKRQDPLRRLTLKTRVLPKQEADEMLDVKRLPPHCRAFDFEKVEQSGFEILLRNRKAGDYITPLGMTGTKKIQDYRKIPKEMRDEIPLVCLGSEVLWIADLGHGAGAKGVINENYKITGQPKQVLLLTLESVPHAVREEK